MYEPKKNWLAKKNRKNLEGEVNKPSALWNKHNIWALWFFEFCPKGNNVLLDYKAQRSFFFLHFNIFFFVKKLDKVVELVGGGSVINGATPSSFTMLLMLLVCPQWAFRCCPGCCCEKWNATQNGIWLKIECNSKWNITQNRMWLKMECDWKWHVTQNGMSLKMECHSKWNVTQNGMSPKIECHSKWNVTQNGMSLKMEWHSKWNVTQNRMSLNMECHSNGMTLKWNVTQMECHSKWNYQLMDQWNVR